MTASIQKVIIVAVRKSSMKSYYSGRYYILIYQSKLLYLRNNSKLDYDNVTLSTRYSIQQWQNWRLIPSSRKG